MSLFGFGGNEEKEERSISRESFFSEFETVNDSGQTADPNTALNLSAVYSCMYVISSSLAQLPLTVLKKTDGRIEKIEGHPISMLISQEPNQWQTSYKWRETEQFRALGWGNAYTWVKRKRGIVSELRTLQPWVTRLAYRDTKLGRRYFYESQDPDTGRSITIALDDMIHVKDVSYDEKTGKSRISQQSASVELGLSMQTYGNSFFGSNGRATGVISPKENLNSDSWTKFKSMFAGAMKTMSSSSNKTMLLPSEITYQALTIPPEDMQFLESRKFSRSEIAGWFNVPPHMIGVLEDATFSNISEQALQFVRHTMMPWVVSWEQELNRRLFTTDERSQGYYVKFNLSALLRGTPTERAEFLEKMVNAGLMSRNEARALEDLNDKDGLDEMVISQNVKSVRYMEADADLKEKEAELGPIKPSRKEVKPDE